MKYSRAFAGAVLTALLITPAFVSALTLDELNQQIAALLSQVAALQQKIAAQPQTAPAPASTNVSPATAVPASHIGNFCPQLSRSLSIGARGDDVLSLQQFLESQGLLSVDSATGYFGALTQSAVQQWQLVHGVVTSGDPSTTGFGVVGARTRSLIALNCSAGNTNVLNPNSSVAPTASCPVAPPPTEICSTGWQANTDGNGCTTSYKCVTVLQTVTPASSNKCVLYSIPVCSAGYAVQGGNLDANGCAGPAQCVAVNSNTSPSVSVNLPSSAAQGSTITITWNSWNAPANSAVVLTTQSNGRIAQGLSTSGTYSWKIPGSNCTSGNPPSCSIIADNPNVWATTAGQTLQISAQLYTPAGASLGGGLLAPSTDLVYLAKSPAVPLTITALPENSGR